MLFRIGDICIAINLAMSLYIVVNIVISLQCVNCEHATCLGMGFISPFLMLSPCLPSVKAELSGATHELASSSQNSSQNYVVMPSHPGDFSLPNFIRACQHSSFVNGLSMLVVVVGLTLSWMVASTCCFA